MGSDVVIITKNEIVSGDVKLSRFELLPDRGFGSFIMNAKFKEKPVINELERILQHNVDFLLEPEYYDPNIHGYEAVMGSTISNAAPVRGFVKIDAFIENLEKLQVRMAELENYGDKMNYDKDWWLNYFDNDFTLDISSIKAILENAQILGDTEFTFDFS